MHIHGYVVNMSFSHNIEHFPPPEYVNLLARSMPYGKYTIGFRLFTLMYDIGFYSIISKLYV